MADGIVIAVEHGLTGVAFFNHVKRADSALAQLWNPVEYGWLPEDTKYIIKLLNFFQLFLRYSLK
jgi:hypothetical protein